MKKLINLPPNFAFLNWKTPEQEAPQYIGQSISIQCGRPIQNSADL